MFCGSNAVICDMFVYTVCYPIYLKVCLALIAIQILWTVNIVIGRNTPIYVLRMIQSGLIFYS